jgi:hypothetical protein
MHNSTDRPLFESDVQRVQRAVRDAFAAILDGLPSHVRRPHEVSKLLGIDKKLGWKIVKLIEETDPLMSAQHVPGAAGVDIFLKAAAEFVPAQLTELASAATEEFERLVRVHAGDRAALEMMATACAGAGGQGAYFTRRKKAFEINSYLWGVQAKTQLKAHVLNHASEPGRLDMAWLRGLIGLRRIRSNVPWVIGRSRVSDDRGRAGAPVERQPLDEDEHRPGAIEGAPLVRAFCSEPPPEVRRYVDPDGVVEDELVEGPVGNTGTVTCVTGEVARSVVPFWRSEHNRFGEVNSPLKNAVFTTPRSV